MPRTRKTMTGQAAQPISPVPGQMYGMGQEQMEMQRAMPAPQAGTPGAPVASNQPGAVPGAPTGGVDLATLLQRAQGLREQTGILTQPTARPTEPITAGLSGGPGFGPEALGARRGSPVAATLRKLSLETGDPEFARLADRA